MILVHTKYPQVSISTPSGHSIKFDNFEASVLPQTMKIEGMTFFEHLLQRGVVSIKGNKSLEEHFEGVDEIDVDNADIVEDTTTVEGEGTDEKKETKKKPGKPKGNKKK